MKTLPAALCTPYIKLCDTLYNTEAILTVADKARRRGAKIAIFPAMVVTGHNIGSLIDYPELQNGVAAAIKQISARLKVAAILGYPQNGRPVFGFFDGKGGFSSIDDYVSFEGYTIRLGKGEDSSDICLWSPLAPRYAGSEDRLRQDLKRYSEKAPVIAVGAAPGESVSKQIYSCLKAFAVGGEIISESFDDREDTIFIKIEEPQLKAAATAPKKNEKTERPLPYIPLEGECNEILEIMARGIYTRIREIGCRKVILGLSGGLDSAAALLAAVKMCERYEIPLKNVIAVVMPGPASGQRTQNNAVKLATALKVTLREIPIGDAVKRHLKAIGHQIKDVVYENAQARERAQILFDLGNKENALVLGTGDLSEAALGWSTYGGDQLAQYNPNASLTKTALRKLLTHYAQNGDEAARPIISDIVATPVSPELLDGQETEGTLGSYEVNDFYLYSLIIEKHTVAETFARAQKLFSLPAAELKRIMKIFTSRVFKYQFKRLFGCDGARVFPYDFEDLELRSDMSAALWQAAAEKL